VRNDGFALIKRFLTFLNRPSSEKELMANRVSTQTVSGAVPMGPLNAGLPGSA
jgi:hypothetical protein